MRANPKKKKHLEEDAIINIHAQDDLFVASFGAQKAVTTDKPGVFEELVQAGVEVEQAVPKALRMPNEKRCAKKQNETRPKANAVPQNELPKLLLPCNKHERQTRRLVVQKNLLPFECSTRMIHNIPAETTVGQFKKESMKF